MLCSWETQHVLEKPERQLYDSVTHAEMEVSPMPFKQRKRQPTEYIEFAKGKNWKAYETWDDLYKEWDFQWDRNCCTGYVWDTVSRAWELGWVRLGCILGSNFWVSGLVFFWSTWKWPVMLGRDELLPEFRKNNLWCHDGSDKVGWVGSRWNISGQVPKAQN